MARKRPEATATRTGTGRPKPRPRHIDHSASKVGLVNKRDDRRYVLVNTNDPHGGVGHYEELGYKVEEWNDDSDVRVRSVTPEKGKPPEKMGSVLMSIDKERWEEIEEYGPEGVGGQAGADELEERIVAKQGVDELRGLHRYLHGSGISLDGEVGPDKRG